MTESIQICLFSEEHLEQVEKLEKECFSQPFSKSILANSLFDDTISAYVAIMNDEVVAYLEWQNVCDLYLNINSIETHPNYRRKGIAKLLLDRMLSLSNGMDITLEVRESNSNAIGLYSNYDFTQIGIRKNYYKNPTENALILQRNGEKN